MKHSPVSAIRFGRSHHVDLHYRMMSQMDLGADAANLFIGDTRQPKWAEDLQHAYREDMPKSLELQFSPLRCANLETLIYKLQQGTCESFRLAAKMLSQLAPDHDRKWQEQTEAHNQRIAEIYHLLSEPLATLRSALWSRIQQSPWPLTIFHTPAMGKHGRAVGFNTQRAIAVSFDAPTPHVLCQIFHEETHVVSDRQVKGNLAQRSTHKSDTGYALHRALERGALALGQEIIQTTAPEYCEAYEQWMDAFR